MSADDYQTAVRGVGMSAIMLTQFDLPAILAAIRRAEDVGWILDPTLYRDKGQAMREDRAMLEAALPLWEIGKKLASLSKPS